MLISEYVKLKGGMTYDPYNKEAVTDGYCVAIEKNETIVEEIDEKMLDEYMTKFYEYFEDDSFVLGLWLNPDNEKIYLDTVKIFNDEYLAVKFARENKQIAIFHLNTNRTIYID